MTDLRQPQQPAGIPVHSNADEIIRQVEYYFSDTNLPYDEHLLKHCNGINNEPVSIKMICGFAKMRKFKPVGQVIQALLQSAFLEVVEGNKIRRRIPLQASQLAGGDGEQDPEVEHTEAENSDQQAIGKKPFPQPKLENKFQPVQPTNKNLTKNLLKPSGFEESFSEAPITPAEYEDDQKLYDPESPFSERIESAIQRFKQKKTMHQEVKRIFDKWMKYGGIEMRTQFSGVDKRELKEMDKYEQTRLLATHFVNDDRDDTDRWVVDFEGVVKGFISSQLQTLYVDFTEQEVRRATQVMRTFYNYIMHHNVCPEHNSSILAARQVCDIADTELMMCQAAGLILPGAFNAACSVLTNGEHAGKYINDQAWAMDDKVAHPQITERMKWLPTHGLNTQEAQLIVKAGTMAMGTDDQCTAFAFGQPKLEVKRKCRTGLEIRQMERASPEAAAHFAAFQRKSDNIAPLGLLVCKPWKQPDFQPHDLPTSYRAPNEGLPESLTFCMEDEIMAKDLKVGMKLEATICELPIAGTSLWFLDTVWEVKCSFFKWLPNEMIMGDREQLREPVWKDGPKHPMQVDPQANAGNTAIEVKH